MADKKPAQATLMDISAKIANEFQCKELAKALSVKPSQVKKFAKMCCGFPSMIAFGILQHWVEQNGDSAYYQFNFILISI